MVLLHSLGHKLLDRQMTSCSLIGDCCYICCSLGIWLISYYMTLEREIFILLFFDTGKEFKSNVRLTYFSSTVHIKQKSFHSAAGFPDNSWNSTTAYEMGSSSGTSTHNFIPKASTLRTDQEKQGHAHTTNTYILNSSIPSLWHSKINWDHLPYIWLYARIKDTKMTSCR